MKKKGLGKGMSALFGESEIEEKNTDSGIFEIDINKIKQNEKQPRKNFSQESLDELAVSIKSHGIINPITVEKKGDIFVIISGERRWRAARTAGLSKIPAIIKNISDRERLEIAFIENIQRENLNPVEEAMTYKRFSDEFNLSQEEISYKVGKSRASIANSMRLLKLDERVLNFIKAEKLTIGHAKVILSVDDADVQFTLAQKVIEEQLSVRQTECLVKELEKPKKAKNKKVSEQSTQIYKKIADDLKNIFGTKVNLKDKNGKGKIEIEYYSSQELERLIEMFNSIK